MSKSYEQSMSALEELVKKLENGDLPLADAMKHYENGVKMARHCQTLLDEAEKKISTLIDDNSKNSDSTN